MATLRQRTSFGPGIYRGHAFTADRLKSFVDGTNAAIAAGVPIPLLMKHAPINANDGATKQFADEQGAGWVTKVFLDENNHIGFEADAVPSKIAEDSKVGTLKFTSPEFRPHYECEKSGVYSGPVIRHFAFTPTPGNPHQGPIEVLAMSEQCIQLSEADYQGPVQHAELSPVEAPSINAIQDSHYKDTGVPYPKHTDDAADDKDHDTNDMANGEGNSLDTEELVNDENKPKKKKGPKNDNDEDDLEHEQGMDKDTNKDVDTQHAEDSMKQFHADKPSGHLSDTVKEVGGRVHGNYGGSTKFQVPHRAVKTFHALMAKGGLHHGKHYYDLPEKQPSQHAEKNKDGFGSPKNDTPNTPSKQPVNDPNLEVMENPEAPVESAPPENPDMPPKATDKSKLAAIVAGFGQLGLVVPSDWDPSNEGAMDILLGCLNTHIKTKQDTEAEESVEGEGQEGAESPKDAPMPFSEEHRTYKDLLAHHGYEQQHGTTRAGGTKYVHKDGHEIIHYKNDPTPFWNHNPDGKPKGRQGTSMKELDAHLSKFHGSSQHIEEVEQFSEASPECDDEQFSSLGELSTGTRYRVVRRSAKAPTSGGGKFRRAVHIRVYDSHHPKYTGKGSAGLVKEWPNVDSRYEGKKSAHGQALHEAHQHAAELNAEHEGKTQQYNEEPELQFTEDELKAMPAKARKVIEAGQAALKIEREARIKAEQEAIAFAEQEKLAKGMAAKGKAIAAVSALPLPPVLKKQLLDGYQSLQFSEAKDEPLYTGAQVAAMVANALPPSLQFMEIETSEGVKPAVSIKVGVDQAGNPVYKQLKDAEQFFEDSPSEFVMTKERANEIANATVGATQTRHTGTQAFSPTIPTIDRIAADNQRHPNRVRNW